MFGSRLTSRVFLAAAMMAAAVTNIADRTYAVARSIARAFTNAALHVVKVVAHKDVGFTWLQDAAGVPLRVLRFAHYQRRQERTELALPRLGLA